MWIMRWFPTQLILGSKALIFLRYNELSLLFKNFSDLINESQKIVEKAYENKLEENFGGDEYFKRGFLFACKELTAVFLDTLKKYEIRVKEE